ncbi:MAG: TIGR02206 family membrane protein, partial [Candidatus Marinimicrobia bacterium]|nr:TIGR02206 family membrane protein [Candidatus Neomarinimicrobiota bacterium]
LLVITTIFLTVIENYRPTQRSIWKVFLITNFYLIFIASFNYIFDSNYLFICYKPINGSIMDVLGSWPWYILSLEVVGLISFYIYYLPFLLKDSILKINRHFRK